MIYLYFLTVFCILNSELLNRCKVFNIKENECINSSFVPNSEYNNFLRNYNLPIIKDDNCEQKKCNAPGSKTLPQSFVPTKKQDVILLNPVTLQSNSDVNSKTTQPNETKSVQKLMTLTTTTTSTIMLAIPKQKSPDKETVTLREIDPKANITVTQGSDSKANNTVTQGSDDKANNTVTQGSDEKKQRTTVTVTEKQDTKTATAQEKKIPPLKPEDQKNEKEDKKASKNESITTVIREISTTVTVEVPLTLYREHTTTSISKVPIINYSLTTFTEHNTTTETFYKTTTMTSEVYKTKTYTTELMKTTTVKIPSSNKPTGKTDENLDSKIKSKAKIKDKDDLPESNSPEKKQKPHGNKESCTKNTDEKTTSAEDYAKHTNVQCVTQTVDNLDHKSHQASTVTVYKEPQNNISTVTIDSSMSSLSPSSPASTMSQSISTVYLPQSPGNSPSPVPSVPSISTVYLPQSHSSQASPVPSLPSISTVYLPQSHSSQASPVPSVPSISTVYLPQPHSSSSPQQPKSTAVYLKEPQQSATNNLLPEEPLNTVTVTQTNVSTITITPQLPKEKPKVTDDNLESKDDDLLPLLKVLIKNTLDTKQKEHSKMRFNKKKMMKSQINKNKKKKCMPKVVCFTKKCLPAKYDKLCNNDNVD